MALYFEKRPVLILNYAVKYLSSNKIDKNITLLSNEKSKVVTNSYEIKMDKAKTLVIMPTWLHARDKHINKYAKTYLDYGFDVLTVRLKLWQLLWPVKGTQVVASNILKFLETNNLYSPLVLHGFSIGGYLWGEALVQMEADKKRFQPIIDKTSGQIWDSLADITQIPVGTPKAMFPNNKFLETLLRSYLIFHMKAFDKTATCHYRKSRSSFYDNLIRTPMLILGSKIDPIATEETLRALRDYWERNGIKVYWKLWDDSPHVSHMFKHPNEYNKEVTKYLKDVNVIDSKVGA